MVEIYFDSLHSIRKPDRNPIAEQLVSIVASNLSAHGEDRSIEKRYSFNVQLPPQIKALHLWRPKPLLSDLWQSGDARLVKEDFAPYLQEKIDKKNLEVAKYKLKCDNCWLVIVADWKGPSSFFSISDNMVGLEYNAAFNRVYFVEGFSGHVVALKIKAISL